MSKRSTDRFIQANRWINQHLRDIPGRWFFEDRLPDKFSDWASRRILPDLKLAGYKLAEKKRIALHCLHRLIGTGLAGRCIMDSRDTHLPGVSLRNSVWDSIVKAKLAIMCLGSKNSQQVTRYQATDKLLALEREWKLHLLVNTRLHRNSRRKKPTKHALVMIYTGKKVDPATGLILPSDMRRKLVPLVSTDPATEYIEITENILEAFNSNNLDHRWKAFDVDGHVFQPNPCLRQIFAGGWPRLGRFYSWGDVSAQNLPKSVRRKMRIDGKLTAELDLEGSLLRMFYHYQGIDPNPSEDIYRPEIVFPKLYQLKNLSPRKKRVVRGFVKTATIICLNTKSQSAANSSTGELLGKNRERDFLTNAIYRIEGISPKGIVKRLVKLHEPITDTFFKQYAPWMMTDEARVMEDVMMDFTFAMKPALLIHDAVVVKRSDVVFARNTITGCYRNHFGFDPVLKLSFPRSKITKKT